MFPHRQARSQAERRQEAEQGLLKAAIHLLVERGFHGFTLAEIGERAGYSRALAAHYFGKKEDLLSQVAAFIVRHYGEAVWCITSEQPGLERLTARIRRYSEYLTTPPSRALNILMAEAAFHPTLRRAIARLHQEGTAGWSSEIAAGIEVGDVRPDVNIGAQTSIIYCFLRGLSTFLALDPKFPRAEATEEFIEELVQRIAIAPAR